MSIVKNSLVRCITVCGVLGLFLQCAGCLPMWSKPKLDKFIPEKSTSFAVGIQQGERKISVSDHEATLTRKPFEMIFYFDKLDTILVQASFNPNALQMAKAGVRMDKIIDASSQISENFQNPEGLLYAYSDNNQRYHNWAYLGKDSHRYDTDGVTQVSLTKGGGYLCTRSVKGFCLDGQNVKIQKCPANRLYLVFFRVKRNPEGQLVETQRDWITIKLK
ncbi:MAG: hypothetical protein KAR11_02030 [Phycisphaerae bacterium]|nr:hypothetical protein [Phycisphaerae bacterium]